jgi:hypothetical protein
VSPRLATVLASALAVVLAATLAPACSNNAEGERCDTRADNAGNDDCQDGLRCTPDIPGSQSDICCPPDRAQATTAICGVAPSPGGNVPPTDAGAADVSTADTTVTPDTSTPDTSVTDATNDVLADAADAD